MSRGRRARSSAIWAGCSKDHNAFGTYAQITYWVNAHLELGALEEAGLEKSDGAVDPPNSEEPEVDEPNKPGEEEGGAKLKPEDAAVEKKQQRNKRVHARRELPCRGEGVVCVCVYVLLITEHVLAAFILVNMIIDNGQCSR
eukprot:1148073-Pelagomonas_calceolata.AAC.7